MHEDITLSHYKYDNELREIVMSFRRHMNLM